MKTINIYMFSLSFNDFRKMKGRELAQEEFGVNEGPGTSLGGVWRK